MLRTWKLSLDLEPLRQRGVPMYQTLADELRRLIEEGVLREGDVLPGSRELAQQLGISRKTVVTAMNRLIDYGLLEQRERVGLFVRRKRTEADEAPAQPVVAEPAPRLILGPDVADATLLPSVALGRAYRNNLNRAARINQLGYVSPKGYEALRNLICAGLCHGRSLCVDQEEVLITRGSPHGVYLAAHALLRPGDAVAVESMTHDLVRGALTSAGLRIVDLPVDHDGVRVDALAEALHRDPQLRAVYLTPRYNYPMTVALSQERCHQLAELVISHQLLAIEDDFDGFISLNGHQAPTFCSLLPKENYIYLSTGTRLLSSAVRVGFVAGSREHIAEMATYRMLIDIQGDTVLERALRDMIDQGELRRHIRNINTVYAERLDYISRRIRHELRDRVWYRRPDGGLAIWLEMREDPTPVLSAKGIVASPVELEDGRFGLRIGYATLTREQVDLLIEALKGIAQG